MYWSMRQLGGSHLRVASELSCWTGTKLFHCRLFVELAFINSVARVALSGTPLQVRTVLAVPNMLPGEREHAAEQISCYDI